MKCPTPSPIPPTPTDPALLCHRSSPPPHFPPLPSFLHFPFPSISLPIYPPSGSIFHHPPTFSLSNPAPPPPFPRPSLLPSPAPTFVLFTPFLSSSSLFLALPPPAVCIPDAAPPLPPHPAQSLPPLPSPLSPPSPHPTSLPGSQLGSQRAGKRMLPKVTWSLRLPGGGGAAAEPVLC